ncbi:signal peptide peptidase SppA [Tuanshanicoccus lijuaniae]|uniref:signal peptide peptidase SppA n=1 Tax=Aerococcaceae bacterium zg-1292 TaxID=2774330 RepID=UPI001BD85FC7|nr:signal peptide peptidase SppA [Aerococcaceae bacterium zg-A91]MBS4458150.1 signal peptide peptidase SppA [Aerococcaceae bacterium zg-BR33]
MTFLWSLLADIIAFILLVIIVAVVGFVIYQKVKKKDKKLPVEDAKIVVLDTKVVLEQTPLAKVSSDTTIKMETLKKALTALGDDEQIDEVAIDLADFVLSPAQIFELEPYFERLRQQKTVVAYGTELSTLTMYLTALLASKVCLLDSNNTDFSLQFKQSYHPYYKQMLEKIGITLHILHIGSYKGTGEEYELDSMSPEKRESLVKINRAWLDYICQRVSEKRQMEFREPLLAGQWYMENVKQAVADGIVDELVPYQAMPRADEGDAVSIKRYADALPKEKKLKKKAAAKQNKLIVLPLEGVIGKGHQQINSDTLYSQLKQLKELDNIKGIVLAINSPGGSALESEKMYQRLKSLDVPVYAWMQDVAASGGYYIASAAEKIMATDTSLVGSIGVVAMLPEMSAIAEKVGINLESYNLSQYEQLHPLTPLSSTNKAKLLSRMHDVYREFKARVMAARHMDDATLEPLAQGKVYLGQQAQAIGLVDQLATLDETIKALAKAVDIDDYVVKIIAPKQDLKSEIRQTIGGLSAELVATLDLLSGSETIQTYEPYRLND